MTAEAFAFPDFNSDCTGCAALCCVALHFDKGEAFALDKTAGTPCPNLSASDFSCTIHADLLAKGFSGCTRYDCNGAGQRVIQEVFDGQTWRERPALMPDIIDSFRIMRRLHDTLEILSLLGSKPLSPSQAALHQDLLTQFQTPAAGWSPNSLRALESSAAFQCYTKALPAFQSALRP